MAAQENYLPYGTLPVTPALIADQTEIVVSEWLGYVVSVRDSNTTRFLRPRRKLSDSDRIYLRQFRYPDSLLPDSSIFRTLEWTVLLDSVIGYESLQCNGSNSHQTLPLNATLVRSKTGRRLVEQMLNKPVTGISFEQALAFCRWRTQIDSLRAHPEYGISHYTFRLPTVAEYNFMNSQSDSTIRSGRSFNYIIIGGRFGAQGFNYKNASGEYLSVHSTPNDLQSVWGFDCDTLGLYGIQGNAAEMTTRKGAACGGSYFHFAIESYKYRIQVYEGPQRWLGFRCVGEIL